MNTLIWLERFLMLKLLPISNVLYRIFSGASCGKLHASQAGREWRAQLLLNENLRRLLVSRAWDTSRDDDAYAVLHVTKDDTCLSGMRPFSLRGGSPIEVRRRMTVYVDDVGHRFKHMIMCHMWADTLDELLQMAEAIGIAAKWLQGPPKSSWLHFDIPVELQTEVMKHGARLTDRFGPVEHLARLRGDDACLATIARARALRGLPADGFLKID